MMTTCTAPTHGSHRSYIACRDPFHSTCLVVSPVLTDEAHAALLESIVQTLNPISLPRHRFPALDVHRGPLTQHARMLFSLQQA